MYVSYCVCLLGKKLCYCHSSFFCLFFSSLFLGDLAKVVSKFLSNCFIKNVWPGLELLRWQIVCFQDISFRYKLKWWIRARASGIFLFSNLKHIFFTIMPMTTKFGRGSDLPWGLLILWSCGLSKSPFKLKPLYLYYHCISTTLLPFLCHQTWHDGSLPWQAPTHKATWPFDHVMIACDVTRQTTTIIIQLSLCLWPPNLVGWWHSLSGSQP